MRYEFKEWIKAAGIRALKTVAQTAGDTLWGISSKLLGAGARWTEIAELNGLTSTVINIGRGLKIPQEVRRDKP